MFTPETVADYRLLAQEKLPKKIFDFIDSGAGDEITKQNNRQAYNDICLRPLCLRDVSSIDPSLQLLKQDLAFPFLIAPTAFHQLVNTEGELSAAKAAKTCGIGMIASCMSNRSLEDIMNYSEHKNLWLQIYIFKNRALTKELIYRAEAAGYKAIIITIGVPLTGKRDRDIRNQFTLPPELTTGNFESSVNKMLLSEFTKQELDPSLTWQDIEWVKTLTTLPVIVKGILHPLDAETACQLDISGIVVSNHGGRQIDTSAATMKVLPDIVETVAGRTKILLDGGVQRGTDIFKAIALGADALLAGRAILWALAVNGEKGVESLLFLLKNEFETTMKLMGCRSLKEIQNMGKSLLF